MNNREILSFSPDAILVENLSMKYTSEKYILKNVSFSLPQKRRCAIIGLNGSGKTTLLKGILGLESSTTTKTLFFGKKFSEKASSIAYVPQIKAIDWSFPITVYDVVKMGCYSMTSFFGMQLHPSWEEKVQLAISKMNLELKQNNQINNLSGGEKQRVFIARALAQEPDMYILDEPLTGLDMVSEKIISDIFLEMVENNKTIVAVHHDLHTLYSYFDSVLIVHNQGVTYCDSLSNRKEIDELIKVAFSRY
jgi:manganese/zinc/iron transport system ATP- binding protein